MIKKKQSTKIMTKSNITLLIAIAAFILGLFSIVWTNLITDSYYQSQRTQADSIFEISVKNAMQDYCIDHSIKPCTRENINKDSEATN